MDSKGENRARKCALVVVVRWCRNFVGRSSCFKERRPPDGNDREVGREDAGIEDGVCRQRQPEMGCGEHYHIDSSAACSTEGRANGGRRNEHRRRKNPSDDKGGWRNLYREGVCGCGPQ